MDIAKLKELLGAGTPGEWVATQYGYEKWSVNGHAGIEVCSAWNSTNAALIVAAVNSLPSLLARVEAADKLAEVARGILEYGYGYGIAADKRLSDALATYNKESAK